MRPSGDYASSRSKWRVYFNNRINYSDGKPLGEELILPKIAFYKTIITEKNGKNLYLFALVEFGCELFLPQYFLKKIRQQHPNHRIVVLTWVGRSFLYKNHVDEIWEIRDEYMWLRETVRAFVHVSKNIKKLESYLKSSGDVFPSYKFGNMVLENKCVGCKTIFGSDKKVVCPACLNSEIEYSMFADLDNAKKEFDPIIYHDDNVDLWSKSNIPQNAVAIFARARKTYGRNLPKSFYLKLIDSLINRGYKPIWFGEKQSSMPCPSDKILDFSSLPESKDLQYTLCSLKRCVFSFQAWTASTRLSQIANIPYILIETPDQIYGKGHEGKRLFLFANDLSKQKIILCNYNKTMQNLDEFLVIIDKSIEQFVKSNDNSDVLGLVDNEEQASLLHQRNNLWKTTLKKIT